MLSAILNLVIWGAGYFYIKEYLIGAAFLLVYANLVGLTVYLFFVTRNFSLVWNYAVVEILIGLLLCVDAYLRTRKYNKSLNK